MDDKPKTPAPHEINSNSFSSAKFSIDMSGAYITEIKRLQAEIETAKICLDSYADENQRFYVEIERLRAALKRISELDVPRTVRRAWRQDGAPSRHDACPHDLRMYEDCYACIAEYAGAVLEGKEKGDGT